jgi:hypothetical protein
VHAVVDVHDTPDRISPTPTDAGPGVGWIVHCFPSQRSANVWSWFPPLSTVAPTAMHAVAETHDTPDKLPPRPRDWLGVGWIDQWDPSQRSANVWF